MTDEEIAEIERALVAVESEWDTRSHAYQSAMSNAPKYAVALLAEVKRLREGVAEAVRLMDLRADALAAATPADEFDEDYVEEGLIRGCAACVRVLLEPKP